MWKTSQAVGTPNLSLASLTMFHLGAIHKVTSVSLFLVHVSNPLYYLSHSYGSSSGRSRIL